MKYIIEYQTATGIEITEIESTNKIFAKATFYEIYSRRTIIISIKEMYKQCA